MCVGSSLLWKQPQIPDRFEKPRRLVRFLPRPPNVSLFRALWSLLDGMCGVLNGSWGVLVFSTEDAFHILVKKLLLSCSDCLQSHGAASPTLVEVPLHPSPESNKLDEDHLLALTKVKEWIPLRTLLYSHGRYRSTGGAGCTNVWLRLSTTGEKAVKCKHTSRRR